MKKFLALRALPAFALMLMAACASASGGDTGQGRPGIPVVVENTATPAADLTVYVISPTGARQLIGSVPPGQTVTLRYTGSTIGGQFRLLARPTGGNQFLSNTFSFNPEGGIRWNVYSNIAVPINN